MFGRTKEEPPVVEFAASIPGIAEQYPIEPTRKFLPEWWREMDRKTPWTKNPWDAGTIKTCPAIVDAMLSGWIMPLPFDIAFSPQSEAEYRWETPPGSPAVRHHVPEQAPGIPTPPGYAPGAIKFEHFWTAKTPPGYSLRIDRVPLVWDPPLEVFPAIVDFDYHHHLIPVFRFRHMDRGERTVVTAGTPLCHLTLVDRRAEATIGTQICPAGDGTFERRVVGAMGGIGGGRRLIPGAYKAKGRKWKRQNGVEW